ncbi:MAG: RNA polymerase sigma factor [Acidimicrobiales bacterium]
MRHYAGAIVAIPDDPSPSSITPKPAGHGHGDGDGALVAAAQAGDGPALDALLHRHYDRLHGLCRRMCGNEADADDATQEALMAIVRGLDRFDRRSSFATWAYRVASNACLDELRRRARRPRSEADGEEIASSSAADATDHLAERLDIDAALTRLRPEERAAVVLRDLCGLDYAGIAEVLDIAPGTVRSRIARGRARLADLLDDGNRGPSAPRPSP